MTKAKIEDIEQLAGRIKDNWSLCKLFEGTKRAAEAEMLVAQTIHACVINYKKHGEAFSFRGEGVFRCCGDGLWDNRTAYGMLIDRGFFVEGEHVGRVVIHVTQKLSDYLYGFFARESVRSGGG